MTKSITLNMVKQGFDQGLIKIIDCPNEVAPVAKIGEYWIYFAGMEGEGVTASEYLASVPMDEIAMEVLDALDGIQTIDDTEYMYYWCILTEGGVAVLPRFDYPRYEAASRCLRDNGIDKDETLLQILFGANLDEALKAAHPTSSVG